MRKIVFLIFTLLFSLTIFSQVQIKKSNDIIVVLGRKYYIHTVKQGETLYSISRVYNVPINQILLVNKEEVKKLKAGETLRIPVIDKDYTPYPLTKITFTYYKVKRRRQSLYDIAQSYGISQDQIIKYNPQVENGLKKGMILKIPQIEREQLNAQDDFFIYHQVEKNENLQSLTKKFNVSIEQLKQFNEELDIKPGNIIAIPKKNLNQEQIEILKNNKLPVPDFINVDPNYFEANDFAPCYRFKYNNDLTFNIAVLLPLFIDQNYNLSLKAISDLDNAHYYSNSLIFYNFLQGLLLAAKKLENEGIKIHLYIYDTKADSATLASVLQKISTQNIHLVIGPVYSYLHKQIRDFSKKNRINFVTPLSRKTQIIENSPFVFELLPDFMTLATYSADYISRYADTSAISIVNTSAQYTKEITDTLRAILYQKIQYPDSLDFKEIEFSKFITPYKSSLSSTKFNIVLINSTNEIEISAILNNLNTLVEVYNYRIMVIAPAVIVNFTKLQTEWLRNLDVHFPSAAQVVAKSYETKAFDEKYKSIYGIKPQIFAYYGFDALYYFANALKNYGKYFQFCIGSNDEIMQNGMFIGFQYKRMNKNSGFQNNYVRMYHYTKKLEIKEVE